MEASVEPGHSAMPEPTVQSAMSLPVSSQWEPIVAACVAMNSVLEETLQQFWGVDVHLVFLGVSADMHYFWRMDDFHVSQLTLESSLPDVQEMPTALLRLSDAACSSLLTQVLGPRQSMFSFKRLSPLEATILNEFSRDLLAGFNKQLIRRPGKSHLAPLHLMWTFKLSETADAEATEVGKIVLTLPESAVRVGRSHHELDASAEAVPDEFFFHVDGLARIHLGTTRVALADLEQLEPDDMIILENSHSSQMFVVEPETGTKISFQPEFRQQQALTIPYTQELAMMETQPNSMSAKQALWDNLMIEVGAEFEPIKLPLKQLKQMTEGLVIEMGDLVHNRVCLQVEGKTLAWGELIIVGDKFGVRVCKVDPAHSSGGTGGAEPMPAQMASDMAALPPAAPQPAPQQAPVQAAEEENLDKFLNEDFDDTFDDDEEGW
jgi:flagellar motor switch protein FliN